MPARSSRYDPDRHGPRRVVGEGFHAQVYDVVQRVPPGSVTTFGDVAGALGTRSVARHVGFALAALPPERSDVPWHRVITGQGRLPVRGDGVFSDEQAESLRAEGLEVDEKGRVARFREVRHVFAD